MRKILALFVVGKGLSVMARKLYAPVIILSSIVLLVAAGNALEAGNAMLERYHGKSAEQIESERRRNYDQILYKSFKPGRKAGYWIYELFH